jgi:hypothetical protein
MVVLAGFTSNAVINSFYVEQPVEGYKINNRETYWSEKGDYFLFCSSGTGFWAVEKGKRFKQVKLGKSMGVAHSPKGYDLGTITTSADSWWEWDKEVSKWVQRIGAGVIRRGRARPAKTLSYPLPGGLHGRSGSATPSSINSPRPPFHAGMMTPLVLGATPLVGSSVGSSHPLVGSASGSATSLVINAPPLDGNAVYMGSTSPLVGTSTASAVGVPGIMPGFHGPS